MPVPEMGAERSSHWPKCRAAHLASNPTCIACGTAQHLEVHHVLPYHLYPELELEQSNLVTLCETPSHNCHLLLGHGLDWKAFNPHVRSLALLVLRAIATRSYTPEASDGAQVQAPAGTLLQEAR